MGKRKNRGKLKKNWEEVADYKRFIANSSISPESTVPVKNEMLMSSKEFVDDEDSRSKDLPIKSKPLRYKFFDWIKENVFPVIITTIVVSVSGVAIKHMVDLAVLSQRVEALERQVDSLVDDYVTQEILSLQLDKLAASINSDLTVSTSDIKMKLAEIEAEIEILKNDVEKKHQLGIE